MEAHFDANKRNVSLCARMWHNKKHILFIDTEQIHMFDRCD